jgi:hypothetical protein
MLRQVDIAEHLDLSERRLRDILKSLNLDHRENSLDEIRVAYIKDLRAKAAGTLSDDGFDLVKERVLTERVDRELKLTVLAEKKALLINKEQLEPELQNAFSTLRANLLSLADRLKSIIDVQYGIDLDVAIIEIEIHNALSSLSGYDPGDQEVDTKSVSTADTAGEY